MVKKDKDASQKSEQGNRGAAGALAEELWPRSGASCQDERSHLVSIPHLGLPTPQSLSPFNLALPLSGVLEFRSSPRAPPLAPAFAEHRSIPLPFVAGVPGAHLGAGTGPAHRPEQQERQAQQAGGAGHGGALRTGP